ncbi:class I SAM-dependent methyltransferase, partial [bacterium]|nr:class I SAM-dependent methyltransferase [bacterium]
MAKKIAAHPDHTAYLKQWASLYEGKNYDTGLTGYFLKKSHEWSEANFGTDTHFSKVLEVGAGTGLHINFVRHSFDEYLLTDLNPPMLGQIARASSLPPSGKIIVAPEDATRLSFAANTFDRVIAAHVLEHLYQPHLVLQEWGRVLKPGGLLTIVLPC